MRSSDQNNTNNLNNTFNNVRQATKNKIEEIITNIVNKCNPSILCDKNNNIKNNKYSFLGSNQIIQSLQIELLNLFDNLMTKIECLESKNQQQIKMIQCLIKDFVKLPKTDMNEVSIMKEGTSSVREKEIQLKKDIVDQQRMNDITNNRHQYSNGIGFRDFMVQNNNARDIKNPMINLSTFGQTKHMIERQSDVLGVRNVNKKTTPIAALIGQKETYCKVKLIPEGTIIGQYSGLEIGHEKWMDHFANTANYYEQAPYLYTVECTGHEFIIDPKIGANGESPLLFINDARSDITNPNLKQEEKSRCNVKFQNEILDGWPVVLVKATKDIKRNDSLYIDYGKNYGITIKEIKNGRKYEATSYPERQKLLNKIMNKYCDIKIENDDQYIQNDGINFLTLPMDIDNNNDNNNNHIITNMIGCENYQKMYPINNKKRMRIQNVNNKNAKRRKLND